MSARGNGGGGTEFFLPGELDPEFSPDDEDRGFAGRFDELARLIDRCENSESVALLASTCRNQWMTVNAVFVDLRLIVGAERLPDLAARAVFELRRQQPRAAEPLVREALELMSQVRAKLDCWNERESLLAKLEVGIESTEQLVERDNLRAWLARQKLGIQPPGAPAAQAQYLALDLRETDHGADNLEIVRIGERRLSAALRALLSIAQVANRFPARGEEDDAGQQLFDPVEMDSRAQELRKMHYSQLCRHLEATARDLGATATRGADALALEFRDGELVLPDEPPADEDLRIMLDAVTTRAAAAIDRVRDEMLEHFRPNVARAPMPSPFVIDLSPRELESGRRARPFRLVKADGRRNPVPDSSKIALLSAGMPESAYSHTEKHRYAYDRDQTTGSRKAKEIALAAVDAAAGAGAALLALPEAFVPRACHGEVEARAREAGIALVAGLEYPNHAPAAVNEIAVHLPELPEQVVQRKQGPSIYEIRQSAFEADHRLTFVRRSALGNFAAVVCSDFLELDLIWALAEADDRLDLVIVCARNPQPDVFERLAIADAARLHAFVAVVNCFDPARPDSPRPSGRGTLIAQPSRDEPLLALDAVDLRIEWDAIEPPQLMVGTLPLASIRQRDAGRSAHGFLPPPRYATWQPGVTP